MFRYSHQGPNTPSNDMIREDEFKNSDILRKDNEIDSVHWKKKDIERL